MADVTVLIVKSQGPPSRLDTIGEEDVSFVEANHSSAVVYYGVSSSVSASSHDGQLLPGETVSLSGTVYFTCAAGAAGILATATVVAQSPVNPTVPAGSSAGLPVPGYGLIEIAGHSYTRDAGTDSSEARSPWQMMLSQMCGSPRVVNYGRGSAKTHDPAIGYGSFMEMLARPRAVGPDLPYCGLAISMFGINDDLVGAPLFRNYQRIVVTMLRSSRVFTNSAFTHSHGSNVTPAAGVWGTLGVRYNGGTFRAITTVGATSAYTVPSDYDGGAISFLFPTGPTDVFSGTIKVTRSATDYTNPVTHDGQTDGTFSVSGAAVTDGVLNGMFCKRLTSAGSGGPFQPGDVITITYTAISGTARINGGCIEASPVPTVAVANVARIPIPTPGAHESDSDVANMNAVLPALVAEFDENVVLADIDSALDKQHFATDGRHPNDRGHAEVAKAIFDALPQRTQDELSVLSRGYNPDSDTGILSFGPNCASGGSGSVTAPSFRVSRDGYARLTGRVTTSGAVAQDETVLLLPQGVVPYFSKFFSVTATDGTVVRLRMDGAIGVQTGASVAGRLRFVAAIGSVVSFDLDGVAFPAER